MRTDIDIKPEAEKVIIVGGGVIGIASAHYLNALGFAVTVIDQGKIGGACSLANCGYICPSHALPLAEPGMVKLGIKSLFDPQAAFKIKPQLRLALYRWLFQFSRRCTHHKMLTGGGHLKSILDDSRLAYDHLFADQVLTAQWQTKGLLYVLKSAHGVDQFEATDQLLTKHFKLSAKFIDGVDLPGFDPSLKTGLAAGFLYENDASLEPSELLTNWSVDLKNKGVELLENCQLKAINHSHSRISGITTSQGNMVAEHYVFATGAWSSQLAKELGCHIPVEPCKGYSVTIDRPSVSPEVPMLFPEHRVGITPFENHFRLGSMMEFSGFDANIPPRRIEQLYQSAKPYLNTSLDVKNQQTWFGWRPMTWDSLPIIGQVPKVENAWLATGHNMLGMTLAPATGKLVAALVSGQQPEIDPEPYSPARF